MSSRILKYFRFGSTFAKINHTLATVTNYAGFKVANIGQEINRLFFADEVSNWKKISMIQIITSS